MNDRPSLESADVAASLGLGPSSPLSRVRRWLPWLALAALLIAALLVWRLRDTAPAVRYTTQAAQRGDLTVLVTATGNLEPTNQVDVGTEVSGTIASVEVDYNDRVEVGQVLAKLDTTSLEAQVLKAGATRDAAKAKVLQAQADIDEASKELARLRRVHELSGGKMPSQSELDAAEATLQRARADEASARASVTEASAALKVNETDLRKAVVHSPINGVVLQRDVDPGQTVAASLQAPVLFTLAEDLARMELHVYVDEADVGQVAEGQEASFTVDAYPDRRFPAHIIQVRFGSEEVDGVITYETLLEVDNSDLSLRPGMTATAEIVVRQVRDALLVPNAALRFTPPVAAQQAGNGGGGLLSRILPHPPRPESRRAQNDAGAGQARVWVLRDGQPQAIAIETGDTDGIHTVVTGGDLAPGTALLVDSVSTTE